MEIERIQNVTRIRKELLTCIINMGDIWDKTNILMIRNKKMHMSALQAFSDMDTVIYNTNYGRLIDTSDDRPVRILPGLE